MKNTNGAEYERNGILKAIDGNLALIESHLRILNNHFSRIAELMRDIHDDPAKDTRTDGRTPDDR